jgi:hypothetical protein
MSKYDPLWRFVQSRGELEVVLTFGDIEKILGFPIDHSFLTFKKEIRAFGYEVGHISLKRQTVLFLRK